MKAYIVGKGSPSFNKDDDQNFFSVATVTNIQDTIISFWIMNESWAVENWITNNDSVYLKFLGNDLNSPTQIKLLPHKSIDFYFFLRSEKNVRVDNKFKLGFYFTDPEIGFSHSNSKAIIQKAKKYWSNELKLENNVIGYKMEVDPNYQQKG